MMDEQQWIEWGEKVVWLLRCICFASVYLVIYIFLRDLFRIGRDK
jgi:hypothetical protein